MSCVEDSCWKLSYLTCFVICSLTFMSTNAKSAASTVSDVDKSGTVTQTQLNVSIWDQIINESRSKGCLFPPTAGSVPENVCRMPFVSNTLSKLIGRGAFKDDYDSALCMALRSISQRVCTVNSTKLSVCKSDLVSDESDGCDKLSGVVKETLDSGGVVDLTLRNFVNNSACQLYCALDENTKMLCCLLRDGLRELVATEKDRQLAENTSLPTKNSVASGIPSLTIPASHRYHYRDGPVRNTNDTLPKPSSGIAANRTLVNEPVVTKVPATIVSSTTTNDDRLTKIQEGKGSSISTGHAPLAEEQSSIPAESVTQKKTASASLSTASELTKPIELAQMPTSQTLTGEAPKNTLKPKNDKSLAGGHIAVSQQLSDTPTADQVESQTVTSQLTAPNTDGSKTGYQTAISDVSTKEALISKTVAPKVKITVSPEPGEAFKDTMGVNKVNTAETESDNIEIMDGDKPPLSENEPQINDASDIGFSPDNANTKPVDNSVGEMPAPQFPEYTDSHFFTYFLTVVVLCIVVYLVFHNKQKIIALIIEGRHERRRRPSTANYKKLDSNLEEVMQGGTKGVTAAHVIY